MSFIIAFVKYLESGREYPLDCLRDDLIPGDEVLTRRSDGKLATGIVVRTEYLNWQCSARIECKTSEARLNLDGVYIPPRNAPVQLGLTTNETLVAKLKGRGWSPQKRGNIHRHVLAFTNDVQTAFILVRSNGIDLQLLESKLEEPLRSYAIQQLSITQGKFVRHYFSHCGFNLYEGILRFAQAFEKGLGNYDRFFVSVGVSDKRTEELKEESRQRKAKQVRAERSEDADIYYASSSGDGGPAYIGDGMWLTAGGSWHDWGR
jgi:hypothetical protein